MTDETEYNEMRQAALTEFESAVIEPLRGPKYWTIWKLAFQRGAEWNEAKPKK